MLKARQIRRSFGSVDVLRGVDVSVTPGRVLGVLGRNGAGKTTLIRVLLGLIEPTSGEVLLDGMIVTGSPSHNRHVGAVLEGSENLYPFMTGLANLRYVALMHGRVWSEVSPIALTMANELGLSDALRRRAGDYSRGMRQQLAIVSALMLRPRYLFLDEPTVGLDVEAKRHMLRLTRHAAGELGAGVVLTSHQSDVIMEGADDVVVLVGGVTAFGGEIGAFVRQFGGKRSSIVIDDGGPRLTELVLRHGVDVVVEGDAFRLSVPEDRADALLHDVLAGGFRVREFRRQGASDDDTVLAALGERKDAS